MKLRMMLPVVAVGLLLTTGLATATTKQQDKMKTCNADAKTKALKGADREAFMKTCLSAGDKAAAATPKPLTAQQQKMKTCNADAAANSLTGAERQKFMKTCLKAK